jgi:hypothetical protein
VRALRTGHLGISTLTLAHNVHKMNKDEVERWLRAHGVDGKMVGETTGGIDFTRVVDLRWLDTGTRLVQYGDRPSLGFLQGGIDGQWFALESHSGHIGTLGIGHGLAGRTRHVLTVLRPVQVLESTAKRMDSKTKMPYDRYIGPGGATQIFIPRTGLFSLG